MQQGKCLCTKVRYELRGSPKSHFVCHCDNCQHFSGSAFMTNVFFSTEDVVVTQGKEDLKHYEDVDTDSGRPMVRSFCKECGSSLFLKIDSLDFTIVCSGNIEEKTNAAPNRQLYVKDKRRWVAVDSDLSLTPGGVTIDLS